MANPLQPHRSIYGWIALDSLRHVGLTPGKIYFRIKLRDAANQSGTYVVELPRKQAGDVSVGVNYGTLTITGLQADISAFHVKYYSDPFPPPTPQR